MKAVPNEKIMEVTVPLYISNYCDSDCKICNMRKSNKKLIRSCADKDTICDQLEIILKVEKISSLLLLTGERAGNSRVQNINLVSNVMRIAFEMGFEKISLNIGALTEEEIQLIKAYVPCERKKDLGLSVFQETYNQNVYRKYFGEKDITIPKSDYHFRRYTLSRWIAGGFTRVNIGILLGLTQLEKDVEALIEHYNELIVQGAEVDISLPRIHGHYADYQEISDEDFSKTVKYIKDKCPNSKIILTTREHLQTLLDLIPHYDIISPGTSEVTAYTKQGALTNNPDKSQFVVEKVRPRPSWVLNSILQESYIDNIKYYNCS